MLGAIYAKMEWARKSILAAVFLVFSISGFLFILLNNSTLYLASTVAGLVSIPLATLLYRTELSRDLKNWVFPFSVLFSSFIVLLFYFYVTDPSWAGAIPVLLVVPALLEEFNFRYVVQRLILRRVAPYGAVILQSLVFTLYYSRYTLVDHGAGFPFPYNLLFLSSVFGMGLVYGMLSKVTKNFILPTAVHFALWTLFPILAHFPGLASTLVPS